MSLYKQAQGYLIHQRDFSNSSLIIEFFSLEYGMISIIAKGIKTNKLLKPQLQYFSPLKIQYYGKSQLKTLVAINVLDSLSFDNIIEKTAGLYLNELLHYSLAEFDLAEKLYQSYQNALSLLGKGKLTPILREFEQELLKYNGFELNCNLSISNDCWICIDEHMGITEASKDSDKLCKNADLIKFLSHQSLGRDEQKRINRFMIQAIDMSLNYRRLYSREMLKTLTSVRNV